jgi:UDP-glucose 4-epimerase
VIDNLVNASLEAITRVEAITGRRIRVHLVDMCNRDALELVFKKQPPFQAVIHFAALKVRACMSCGR